METVQCIKQYLQAVPKAELHVHLEGAILPETFLLLAQRNHVSLPVKTAEEARQWFTYRDFPHFVEIFVATSSCLKTAEDYELVAYEFGAEMARQNVRYAEVTFSASTHEYTFGVPHDIYFRGLQKGRARAQAEFGVEIRWIFDIVRDIPDEAYRLQRAYPSRSTRMIHRSLTPRLTPMSPRCTIPLASLSIPSTRFCSMAYATVSCLLNRSARWKRRSEAI